LQFLIPGFIMGMVLGGTLMRIAHHATLSVPRRNHSDHRTVYGCPMLGIHLAAWTQAEILVGIVPGVGTNQTYAEAA
jgi:hypothetical protein